MNIAPFVDEGVELITNVVEAWVRCVQTAGGLSSSAIVSVADVQDKGVDRFIVVLPRRSLSPGASFLRFVPLPPAKDPDTRSRMLHRGEYIVGRPGGVSRISGAGLGRLCIGEGGTEDVTYLSSLTVGRLGARPADSLPGRKS